MGDIITEQRKKAESNDVAVIVGEPVITGDGDPLENTRNSDELTTLMPVKENLQTTIPADSRGEPDQSGAWRTPEEIDKLGTFNEKPIDSLNVELELPSKKLSTNLTGTHYLDYKNMQDTLLFPKGTTIGVKDEIILGAAVDYIVALAKKESQKSIAEKGTPFISAGALLAKLWEN
jgi:hypothetical protein